MNENDEKVTAEALKGSFYLKAKIKTFLPGLSKRIARHVRSADSNKSNHGLTLSVLRLQATGKYTNKKYTKPRP